MAKEGTGETGRFGKPAKQIAHESLPYRNVRSTVAGGDPVNRMLGNYSKNAPADASGVKTYAVNIYSMGKN